ncbi:2-phospho-L-lactate transferase CofD family protein [Actinoplanes sp. NBRC 101535]|uniref:gluconeogenesis factor YvcK family protein n=1 Tax=Actinoplanes sp. NBRC 101535 TaxID=3032196 RepID=UPI0024A4F427|nr:2-phospho-L-lactate transferase CofD family protein [Actinoplanes sp. NBRC 101535]GLY02002.1 putative gluconeogenesis factor [Actinoplanes sp. NBRC 101535]
MKPIRVVAFGGGHGLSASLRALRHSARDLDLEITAIVTVGDDGGSSGRLRVERDALLPPGDLRQALAALADDDPTTRLTARLMQHRFAAMPEIPVQGGTEPLSVPAPVDRVLTRGPRVERRAERTKDTLAGHAVGNLLLLGLIEMLGDPVLALDHAARMLGARGRVLPMARHAVGIEADMVAADGVPSTVRGQHAVAVADGRVAALRLVPSDPPTCPEAIAAVRDADWLIFGPGSWYTSVLPHLLVPELAAAIVASPARRLVTLNLSEDKETVGLSAADHLATLRWYLPSLRLDTVLADTKWAGEPEPVRAAAQDLGAELVLAPLAVADGSPRHDPQSLGVALVPVLGAAR